jgi:tetratricopeptide (TPR) repeat protein
MNNLASTYRELGRHADALAMLERVLEFQRRVLPASHPDIGEPGLLAEGFFACGVTIVMFCPAGMTLYNLSFVYKTSGSLPRALECAREALRIYQASLPPGHEHVAKAQSQVRSFERASK